MKKVLFIVFLFAKIVLSAQTIPQSISYQAVATDKNGYALAEKEISVEISILRGAADGTLEYRELHTVTTDKFGVFDLEIGKGLALNDGVIQDFTKIDWTLDNFFLRTAVDFGVEDFLNGLVEIGTVPFQSVPYAFHANHALIADSLSRLPFFQISDNQDVSLAGLANGHVLTWNETEQKWIPQDPGAGPSKFIRADGTVDLTADWQISTHKISLQNGNLEVQNGTVQSANLRLGSGKSVNYISVDSTFTNASNSALSTQKAIKYYVDSLTRTTWWTGNSTKVWMPNTTAKVGIGTTNPLYKIHISGQSEDAFVFEAPFGGSAPAQGAGTRMTFYPAKAAFRAGRVNETPTAWDDSNIGAYSAAFGYDTKASGTYTFVAGKSNTATGSYSAIFGNDNTASNSYSGVFGTANSAAGIYSFVAGRGNTTIGTTSTAFGLQNEARGSNSVSFGNLSRTGQTNGTGGTNSIAAGFTAIAEGDNSAVFGSTNTSKSATSITSGQNNYAASSATGAAIFGNFNEAYGQFAVISGNRNKVSSFGQAVFGQYNFQIGTDYSGWTTTDAVLILGNGTAEAARSNAFVVLKNGKTGIGLGQNSPSYLLEVGKSGDGSQAIANAWLNYSDKRLKTDIQLLKTTTESLQTINSYSYTWISNPNPRREIGFLAQEVETVFPELVYENSEGIKAIDYVKFTPILWQIQKEQSVKIQSLEKQLDAQNQRIEALENAILSLKK